MKEKKDDEKPLYQIVYSNNIWNHSVPRTFSVLVLHRDIGAMVMRAIKWQWSTYSHCTHTHTHAVHKIPFSGVNFSGVLGKNNDHINSINPFFFVGTVDD